MPKSRRGAAANRGVTEPSAAGSETPAADSRPLLAVHRAQPAAPRATIAALRRHPAVLRLRLVAHRPRPWNQPRQHPPLLRHRLPALDAGFPTENRALGATAADESPVSFFLCRCVIRANRARTSCVPVLCSA